MLNAHGILNKHGASINEALEFPLAGCIVPSSCWREINPFGKVEWILKTLLGINLNLTKIINS